MNEVPYTGLAKLGLPVLGALHALIQTLVQEYPSPCKACVTLREAEAVLVEAQQPFPRSPLELQILGLLKEKSPHSLSATQMASILEAPRPLVRRVCQALTMLDTLEHASHGRYRYAPWLAADA